MGVPGNGERGPTIINGSSPGDSKSESFINHKLSTSLGKMYKVMSLKSDSSAS